MKRIGIVCLVVCALGCWSLEPGRWSGTPARLSAAEDKPTGARGASPDREALIKQFEKTMTGATLVGYFTTNGKEADGLKEEKYRLKAVRKVERGDYWRFEWQYGGKDQAFGLELEVKWAGDTPVVTLTDMLVPGMGKFTARVLFYRDEYAGTWSAGDHGGKLFGKIVPADAKDDAGNEDDAGN
jgi:hypothetical protein